MNVNLIGLQPGCDFCVIPFNYASASFKLINDHKICNFCHNFKTPSFLGEDKLIEDLDLKNNEKIGVTVSGGKDSLYMWLWLVNKLGKDKVIAFNHHKIGLVHPIAKRNLEKAKKIVTIQRK